MAPMSFSDFPDDVQLNILSFLCPIEISRFACTCRRFAALCSHSSPSSELWFAICDRRWGSKTQLRRWSATPSPRLYKTLDGWERLIGFWRTVGGDAHTTTTVTLVFFEWSPSCIIGSRISPSPIADSYSVHKIPFLWLGLSAAGETLSYLHPDNPLYPGVIPVTIHFRDSDHFWFRDDPTMVDFHDSGELHDLEAGSPPDHVMSEIYQYFANRTSPGAEKSSKRQRKKKEEWFGRRMCRSRSWSISYFVKIADYSPTPTRPLQGLWKGISESMNLQFYVVTHDDVGGISCRRLGDPMARVPGKSPIFWTSNTAFLESPFSKEEHAIYSMREHIGSAANMDWEIVSRILCIYCMLPGDPINVPINVEGRIWEYEDGTFGFGCLGNDLIIDLKHVALDGYILDEVQSSH